jgi:hypothetical protein
MMLDRINAWVCVTYMPSSLAGLVSLLPRLKQLVADRERHAYSSGLEKAADFCDVTARQPGNSMHRIALLAHLAGTFRDFKEVHSNDVNREVAALAEADQRILATAEMPTFLKEAWPRGNAGIPDTYLACQDGWAAGVNHALDTIRRMITVKKGIPT